MKLNNLTDNPGAVKKSQRVGRGEGSGRGKTCGRGHKGQKSRSGVSIKGFEGGQNPLYMRLPKRGFNNSKFKDKTHTVSIKDFFTFISRHDIDISDHINLEAMKDIGFLKKSVKKVKLVGKTDLKHKVKLSGISASRSVADFIRSTGGELLSEAHHE